jgi:hypothetical protein
MYTYYYIFLGIFFLRKGANIAIRNTSYAYMQDASGRPARHRKRTFHQLINIQVFLLFLRNHIYNIICYYGVAYA